MKTKLVRVAPGTEMHRFIAAATQSYQKHCGSDASRLAEQDLLGEALGALRRLTALVRSGKDLYPDIPAFDWLLSRKSFLDANSLLSKLPKEAK